MDLTEPERSPEELSSESKAFIEGIEGSSEESSRSRILRRNDRDKGEARQLQERAYSIRKRERILT